MAPADLPTAEASAAPGWRLLWPRQLRHQVLLLLAAVTVALLTVLAYLSAARIEDSARLQAQQAARALAQAAARSSAWAIEVGDPASAERALRELAGLPGVLRIDAVDGRGQLLTTLKVAPNGQVLVSRDGVSPALPQPGERDLSVFRMGDSQALRVWAPAGVTGTVGSVAVTYSLEPAHEVLDRLRRETMFASAAVGVLIIGIVYLFLLRALAPLHRLARFSRNLANDVGRQHDEGETGSREVDELTVAINHASSQLRQQLDSASRAELNTQVILNAAPDTIVGLAGDGSISLVNPAVTSVFGYDPLALAGESITRLLPELDAAKVEQLTLDGLYMRTSGTHVARLETTARRHDGTEFPAEVSIARTQLADGARYACVVRDVTEQRMTYSMLNLYNRALECTTNGVVITDMSLQGQPVFYANPAFAKITGYEVSETVGRNCKFLQGDDHDQPELEVLRQAVKRGDPVTVVLRNYRKDGSLFFNELSLAPVAQPDGQIRNYVGVVTDVSERERARLALAERSARLNAVFDLSPDGYVVFDREGRMVYCNRSFMGMTGWSAEALAESMSLLDFDRRLKALCDNTRPYPPLARMADGEGSFDSEDLLELKLPRHKVLTRLARFNVGEHGESILYFRDVTRETEVDRMKSEFLTTAAHELRTPMVSVFGFTELLLNRPVPDAKRRDVLETIHRQASLLINMVNELLDLARIEARQGKDLKCEPQPLGLIIDRAVGGIMVKGDPRPVEQSVRHAETLVTLDTEKTIQALTNVLSNAYKYSPGGGAIELDTLDGDVNGVAAVGVRVTDHGLGMTAAQVARVFERFYRADPSGNIPGTGLGMSLVKEIVELQGGQVEIDSAPGEGTRVTLWLPLAGALAQDTDSAAADPSALPASGPSTPTAMQ